MAITLLIRLAQQPCAFYRADVQKYFKELPIVLLIGGLALAAGSFLPWEAVGEPSPAGSFGHRALALVTAIAIVSMALVVRAGALSAVVVFLVAGFDLFIVWKALDALGISPGEVLLGGYAPGPGMVAVGFGAAITLVAALKLTHRRLQPRAWRKSPARRAVRS